MSSPVLENATYFGSSNTYGSALIYKCFTGYWFSPGVFDSVTMCGADGAWHPDVNDCYRQCTVVTSYWFELRRYDVIGV